MESEQEFVDRVIGATQRIAILIHVGKYEQARLLSMDLCSEAGRRNRALRGLPEPEPTIDYDPDCHWDGTELLPGEKRREKGEAAEGFSLAELAAFPMDRPEPKE